MDKDMVLRIPKSKIVCEDDITFTVNLGDPDTLILSLMATREKDGKSAVIIKG